MSKPRRLVVRARKDAHCVWAWQGGYVEQGEHSGRPCYHRDTSDGGDKHFLFYHKSLRAWFFGDRLPTTPRVSFAVRSKSDALRPEDAQWDPARVQEVLVFEEKEEASLDLFVDPEFPHSKSSINRPGVRPISLDHGEPQWIPGRQLREGSWKLFDGIEARDLLQGKVGDCWLLSAIAAMAEFPNEVKRVFQRDGLAEGDGRYLLQLFDHARGSMVHVTVDEYVPCHLRHWWLDEAEPYFARAHGDELWCIVLEKAMAKLFGSYGELNGGSCSAAFRALTGMEEQVMWTRKPSLEWSDKLLSPGKLCKFERPPSGEKTLQSDEFFDHLQKCDRQNFLMAASVRGSEGEAPEIRREDGLVEGHAYSIVQVHNVVLDGEKRELRLLELRNPWGGDIEWQGAWSDGDESWRAHPEVARQLRPVFGDDGAFWMCWEDFASIFTTVFVCPKQMRQGAEALAHTLSSVDWRKRQPTLRMPPAQTQRLPMQNLKSIKVTPEVVDAESEGSQPSRPPTPPSAAAPTAPLLPSVQVKFCRWQVELKKGFWADYPEEQQDIFARALQHCQGHVVFSMKSQSYELHFHERMQRNVRTGNVRAVRPVSVKDRDSLSGFRPGDWVHVWSSTKLSWAVDGVVLDVLSEPADIDGATMPVGTLKVSYEGGVATKWIAPQQVQGRLKRALHPGNTSSDLSDDTHGVGRVTSCEEPGELPPTPAPALPRPAAAKKAVKLADAPAVAMKHVESNPDLAEALPAALPRGVQAVREGGGGCFRGGKRRRMLQWLRTLRA